MLLLAAAWALLIAVSFLIGSAVISLADLSRFPRVADRFVLATWTGSISLAIGLMTVSLLAPLVPVVTLLTTMTLLVGAALVPRAREALREAIQSLRPWPAVGFTALLLGTAFFTSQEVTWSDTGLYHAGAIEWLSRFGTVRGIAFLEFRFGFTSAWFALAAAFNAEPLYGRLEALTGGYVLFLASVHFAVSVVRIATGQGRLPDWFAATAYLICITWLVRLGITISPSPDVPVIVAVVVVTWSILSLSNDDATQLPVGASRLFPPQAVPVMLAAAAFSLKATAAPLLLVALLSYVWSSKLNLQFVALAGLTGLLVLPTFLASLMTSGCPLFPSPILCTPLPWSLGGATAGADQTLARDFLRWTGLPPSNAGSFNWITHWARSEPLGTLYIAYTLVSSVVLVAMARFTRVPGALWVISIGLAGVAYVLSFSPTYRFLLGYVVAPPAYLAALLCTRFRLHPIVLVLPMLVAVLSVVTVTSVDHHSNAWTRSAVAYAGILPAGGFSLGVALLLPSFRKRSNLGILPPARLAYAVCGILVGALLSTSNQSSLSGSAPSSGQAATSTLASILLSPPPLYSPPENELIPHSVNDVSYVSPPLDEGCWAVIPCTLEELPPDLRLLNPQQGIGGGLTRR